MTDRPTVSVILPTYKRREMLPRILGPLLEDAATTEVIPVVDGGGDGSYEFLVAAARADNRLRPLLTGHQGQAAAQQLGAEHATGDVLLLLDDDVVPDPHLVSGHALHHQDAEDVVVVGYMPVSPVAPPTKVDWMVTRYADRYERIVRRWRYDSDQILLHLWGGNVSLRRAHLADLPLHRTDCQITYHLDWEFGLRCRKRGMRGRFAPELRATHYYTRTVEQFLRDRAASAADRALIHHLHGDDIGPLPGHYFWHDARGFRRVAVRLACTALPAVVEEVLSRAVHIASQRRLRSLEAVMCDYLDRLRGNRIAREVGQALARAEDGGGLRGESAAVTREYLGAGGATLHSGARHARRARAR